MPNSLPLKATGPFENQNKNHNVEVIFLKKCPHIMR
jgi:hypothetical protein